VKENEKDIGNYTHLVRTIVCQDHILAKLLHCLRLSWAATSDQLRALRMILFLFLP